MSIKTIDSYFDEAKEDDVDFAVINRKEWEAVKAEINVLRDLLSEHFVEWEKDSGQWDEFNWHDRVAVAIESYISQEQPDD